MGNLTTDELIARLANDAAFERAGVERFVFLNDLHSLMQGFGASTARWMP